MQAQARRQQVSTTSVTHAQSVQAVETLVTASLGCIAWLRDLLPSDNFTKSYFTTSDDSFAYESLDGNNVVPLRNSNSFQIMTMARGYTPEADTLLDYIDHGIFDALQKQYLKRFVFGIYLDPKDPNNMVETYSFDFSYYRLPGSNLAIPVMTVGDELQQNGRVEDPVAEAARQGRVPTFKDVKRSVKTLLKTLIHHATIMDQLPKHRHATFKIIYTDETPEDYQPPHFKAGNPGQDTWYFATHNMDEAPEHIAVGKLDTGHHGVTLNITSIASYLPSNNTHNDSAFAGLSSEGPCPRPSAQADAESRARQVDEQVKDATHRKFIWSNDVANPNARSQDVDPDSTRVDDSGIGLVAPIGIRDAEGVIQPVNIQEVQYGGRSEKVPTSLRDLNHRIDDSLSIAETQPLDSDIVPMDRLFDDIPATPVHPSDSLPPSSPISEPSDSDVTTGLETQMLANLTLDEDVATQDTEILNLETQPQDTTTAIADDIEMTTPTPVRHPTMRTRENFTVEEQEGIKCECGFNSEDDAILCEGPCGKWYHIWCLGYHDVHDPNIASEFKCLDCRLRADVSWELIKTTLYSAIMDRQKDVATFRRAIKVAEHLRSMTAAEFTERMACDLVTTRQLMKRLEDEAFIFDQTAAPAARGGRGGRGGKRPRPKTQKHRHTFSLTIKEQPAYRAYFNVDPMKDPRVVGPELKTLLSSGSDTRINVDRTSPLSLTASPSSSPQDICAVDTTPIQSSPSNASKRSRGADTTMISTEPPRKKPRFSVTAGIDLAE